MLSLKEFREQFHSLKEIEGKKDQLIENLIIRVQALEDSLTDEKLHVEREQEATKSFQLRLHDAEFKLRKKDEEINSNSFVSVLIDGDCMVFLDHFVQSAQQGGMEAVRSLRTVVGNFVTTNLKLPTTIQIRIRVYANIKGLASTYFYNQVLDSAESFHMFVRGFNMGHPMCDFVDAGDGKECADSKLKTWFGHDMADVQCQAIIFGGSADDSYARLLQPYTRDDLKNQIILIEGHSFARELAVLKDEFLVAHFPEVFRNTKFPPRPHRVSLSSTPPSFQILNTPSSVRMITNPVDVAETKMSTVSDSPLAYSARRDYPILQNRKGQRLDTIINPPQSLVNKMRSTKHCNMFHILGECSYINCTFLHGTRLDEKEIEARRVMLRQIPCPSGLQCKDSKCLHGHQCPDKACAKIGKGCRFKREMHNVDRSRN